MDKAAELYKTLIDELVKISEHSVGADNVRKGRVPAADSEKINRLPAKLSSADREVRGHAKRFYRQARRLEISR